ncbi:hypothetical protein [Curtobacterium sp. MCBD17_032]|uniref:hypothetical protein n=1 Tax=Curtobacterium sp. MCBD17_032 TaxID=2175659 RepID=UPI000DA9CD96|nr:hypothetical protein [Curtobacterium sp. MCBD17_032]PZE84166.1 hypothetical protein DEI91_09740 [Curtobacterium sp. MCBD17_032]
MSGLAQSAPVQGGAPRQAQDDDRRRVVLAGRLERGEHQDSLSLTLAFDGGTESALIYGPDLVLGLEALTLLWDRAVRRG